jgi:hypothetical protein
MFNIIQFIEKQLNTIGVSDTSSNTNYLYKDAKDVAFIQ